MRLRYKIMLALITIAMGICFMTLQSYALWVARYESGENIAEVGCYSINFLENQGPISLNNTYPMSDAKALSSGIYYSFTVTNTCTTDSSYAVTINPLNTNTLTKNKIKYAIYKSSEARPTTGINLGSVTDINEDLSAYPNASSISESLIVATGSLKGATSSTANDGQSVTYILYLWMDENDTLADANKTFEASVYVSNYASIYVSPSEHTLANLKNLDSSLKVNESMNSNAGICPTYDAVNKTIIVNDIEDSASLLCEAKDDYGTSYYFRGNVTNNYVKFAGFFWRIIRINGDGSIRLIYDGDKAFGNIINGELTSNRIYRQIGTRSFSSSYSDNAYVGYMYKATNQSSYADTFDVMNNKNAISSMIKGDAQTEGSIDYWYAHNIDVPIESDNIKKFSDYVNLDTIFCNDKNISDSVPQGFTNDGYASGRTAYRWYYGPWTAVGSGQQQPRFTCVNTQGTVDSKNDAFSVSAMGNGALTYPVALITTDEAVAAGAFNTKTASHYLRTGDDFWTLSAGSNDGVKFVNSSGYGLYTYQVTANLGVRPVLSLVGDVRFKEGGNGTMEHPYEVDYT